MLVLSVVWVYSCDDPKNGQSDLSTVVDNLSTKDLRIYEGLGIGTRFNSKEKKSIPKFAVFTKTKILNVPIVHEIVDTFEYLERYDVMEFAQSENIFDTTKAIFFTKLFGDSLIKSFISLENIVQVSNNPRLGNFTIFEVENSKHRIVYCLDTSEIKESIWKEIIGQAKAFEGHPNFYLIN